MLAGPIFSREALTTPRRLSHFLLRSGYIAALFVLMYTTRQATIGFQDVTSIGDIARFGSLVFTVFAFIQLSLTTFFAVLFTAGNVAQEKDRQTMLLLLMTDLRDRELVWGKLGASLLIVGVLIVASVPVFVFLHMLGGISREQVAWSVGICAATAFAAGSWGALVAFWRDKTFQTLAISVLGLVFFVAIVEAIIAVSGANSSAGNVLSALNPYRALAGVLNPLAEASVKRPVISGLWSVVALTVLGVLLNVYTVARLRVWNPSRVNLLRTSEEEVEGKSRVKHRRIWANPVIWREMRTRAYGRRIFLIKLVYLLMAGSIGYYFWTHPPTEDASIINAAGFAFVGLAIVSLMLINAQGVTSLTTERDTKTLELLLVTDLTAREFIYGKLLGVLYNTKELIFTPLLFLGILAAYGKITLGSEYLTYIIIGFLALTLFSAMLGLHSGLSYDNSRSAIANSLGTMFFLFIGIAVFMVLLIEARSSFALQFQNFLVFIGAGSIALYNSMTNKNPSNALMMAAGLLPFLTFYSITEFLLGGSLGVCLCIATAYGFATIAMLIPAVSSFDAALGRTTMDNG